MWLNQTVQSQNQNKNSSSTTLSVTNPKIDCAKECPCGVPTIPVPDQWLEVMVTGGFKVWHIIFIIIAFIVTMIVIYCCFHRCRIPRTKQEIEADLMRSNLGNKFRDYLEELPNEPLTFMEALKKVQEIEEKLEQDDAQLTRELGARKRMGWIKLKGKEKEVDKDKDKQDTDKQEQTKEGADSELPKANGGQKAPETVVAAGGPATSNNQPKDSPLCKPLESPDAPAELNASSPEGAKEAAPNSVLGPDRQSAKPTTTKRRRQKPNLSRTKLAKEPLLVDSSEYLETRTIDRSPLLKIPEPATQRAHTSATRTHKKKLKPGKAGKVSEKSQEH